MDIYSTRMQPYLGNYASLKAPWPYSDEINLDHKYHKNHHSLYENCLVNKFVVHVKGNIKHFHWLVNFENEHFFFFAFSSVFSFFLNIICRIWNRFMNFCSLQMQNWNYQIKSKNDISIYKKKKKALFRDLYFHHLIFYFFGIIISNGNPSRENLANIIT